jgi:PPM family protein phosphatase
MIKTEKSHLTISAASHPGMKGKQNEDRYRVTHFVTESKDKTPSTFAVLCDGIGGHRAGEVAAEMGVSIITETIAASNTSQPLKTMTQAIIRASEEIYAASKTDHGRSGMGTTCACVWVIDNRLYTANLGDSRIYLLRDGHFLQLSTDHTWIQEALDAGIISEGEGSNHPNAHVIRRYLGSKKTPEPDFRLWVFDGENDADARSNQGMRLKSGDILMVCSDGLTDLVSDKEIRDVILNYPLPEVPDILIDMANRRGGHDNTTVLLMQTPPKIIKGKKRRWVLGCLALLVIASLITTALLLGLRWWGRRMDQPEPKPSITLTLPASTQTTLPTSTSTLQPTEGITPPQPSITPWPTDTLSP